MVAFSVNYASKSIMEFLQFQQKCKKKNCLFLINMQISTCALESNEIISSIRPACSVIMNILQLMSTQQWIHRTDTTCSKNSTTHHETIMEKSIYTVYIFFSFFEKSWIRSGKCSKHCSRVTSCTERLLNKRLVVYSVTSYACFVFVFLQ